MECDELKLFLYAEGELPPAERDAMQAHLRECESCRATLERLGFALECFGAGLDARAECPAADDLALYAEGGLAATRADEIRQHLAGCPACREELALLAADAGETLGGAEDVPFSPAVRAGIERLQQENLKARMEKVLHNLAATGRETFTPERVPQILARVFSSERLPEPAFAAPPEAAPGGLELRAPGGLTLTIEAGELEVTLQVAGERLAVSARRQGVVVEDIRLEVEEGPAFEGEGRAVSADIPAGAGRVRIDIPEEGQS